MGSSWPYWRSLAKSTRCVPYGVEANRVAKNNKAQAIRKSGKTKAPRAGVLVFTGEKMNVTSLKARQGKADRQRHKSAVLDAWDRLFPKERAAQKVGKQSRLDTDPEVRRKAKEAL